MPAERCEICGRFGAQRHKFIDPRGEYTDKGWSTFWLCLSCWTNLNEMRLELIKAMTPDEKLRYEKSVVYAQRHGF